MLIFLSWIIVVVSESASKGTSVAAVTVSINFKKLLPPFPLTKSPVVLFWHIYAPQATDRDSGINRQINFQVTRVQFMDINGVISAMRNVFEAITTQQKDVYIGIIQWVQRCPPTPPAVLPFFDQPSLKQQHKGPQKDTTDLWGAPKRI